MSDEDNMGDDKGINFLAQAGSKPDAEEKPEPVEETPYELVDSSQIHSIRREPSGTVGIRFKDRKTGGFSSEYNYDGISEETYEAMRSSDSVGKYFGENIKSNPKAYPYRKHEADKP